MVSLQVPPEQSTQGIGQPHKGDVVDPDLAFAQVVDQQVTHWLVLQVAPVDELLDAELALPAKGPHGRCHAAAEHPERVQQLVEVGALMVRNFADVGGYAQQLQGVADGDVGDHASIGCEQGRDPMRCHPGGGLPDRV